AADIRLRPDAVAVLRRLRHLGVRTAVVSDCTHELPLLLPTLPIAPLLDARVFSVEVRRCKPDPEIFLTACRRLDVDPADCLYVGDGGSRELSGAAGAGLHPVRLAAADLAGHLVFDPEPDWSGPVVKTLAEVPALVAGGGSGAPAPAAGRPGTAGWARDRAAHRPDHHPAAGRGPEEGRRGLGERRRRAGVRGVVPVPRRRAVRGERPG
ncbi:HAD family hydrolase, partial [Micromonospora zhanjiangensis]